MGILNVTPDSFYDGGKFSDENKILDQVNHMIQEGANIIDIGAMSSRPGAAIISEEEEISRLKSALDAISSRFEVVPVISIDTMRSGVVKALEDYPISIINDISGGSYDPEIYEVCAQNNYVYIMMHMQGLPHDMQSNPSYEDVTLDILKDLKNKSRKAIKAGLKDVILDVGLGFGKTIQHNYQLLNNLSSFKILGFPLMVGLSRKSMIYKVLDNTPEQALNGTTALHMTALLNGANILRVHDVFEAKEVVKLYETLKSSYL